MDKIISHHLKHSWNLLRFYSKTGIRCAPNVSNITNKPQLTSGYSRPQVINSTVLPKNMILRHCSPIPSITLMDPMIQSMAMTTARRPLTVILAWMLAKDKHLEKYRQLWFRRGFDVLTVRTTPIDLLLPPIGGRVVASNLVKYLTEINTHYNEIVVHAFSVGGYQFCELLTKLKDNEEYDSICKSIKGVVLDSCVYADDAAPGLSRAVTKNPILQPLLEASILTFLTLFRNITTKNYQKAHKELFINHLRCPGLVLYSKDDIVSSVRYNEQLVAEWTQRGIPVKSKCWQQSTHVLHYRDHQYEYEEALDSFIRELKLLNGNVA